METNECRHNWETSHVPKEEGEHIVFWECIKCKIQKGVLTKITND